MAGIDFVATVMTQGDPDKQKKVNRLKIIKKWATFNDKFRQIKLKDVTD